MTDWGRGRQAHGENTSSGENTNTRTYSLLWIIKFRKFGGIFYLELVTPNLLREVMKYNK